MSYEVQYSPLVNRDLEEIKAYLNQHSEDAYRRFLSALRERETLLVETPFMYEQYRDRKLYRRFLIEDYSVFYRVYEERHIILISRILSNYRSIKKML
jgi:plasmid stabilization system protein ParE